MAISPDSLFLFFRRSLIDPLVSSSGCSGLCCQVYVYLANRIHCTATFRFVFESYIFYCWKNLRSPITFDVKTAIRFELTLITKAAWCFEWLIGSCSNCRNDLTHTHTHRPVLCFVSPVFPRPHKNFFKKSLVLKYLILDKSWEGRSLVEAIPWFLLLNQVIIKKIATIFCLKLFVLQSAHACKRQTDHIIHYMFESDLIVL